MTTTADGEVAIYQAHAIEEYRPRIVMAAEDAKALDDQLRAMQLAVLRKGSDYDTIPGMGDKPTLLKPGAEKLIQWFGFGSRSVEVKTELDDPERPSGIADKSRRVGVTYRTDITKTIPGVGEILVARCEGYAGYDEDRFYITAEDAKAKAEIRERRNAARYNRDPKPAKWLFAEEYRAPWNTLIKMAQKRSYVGAAIDATAAAGLFTQDLEDMTPPPGRDDDDSNGAGRRQPAGDDMWENATPAKPRQDQPAAPPEDSRPWHEVALERARKGSFKSEPEALALWREAAEPGKCATREQKDSIQNHAAAWIRANRRKASDMLLRQLPESAADWKAAVEALDGDDIQGCRGRLEEIGRLKAAGTMDETLAGRIGRAIIALCPKAAIKDQEDAA
jgi:hypothetical protein